MKKLFYAIAALAVVASCAKVAEVETNVEPKDGKNLVHMTIRAEAPQTKTYIDQTGTDTYQPQWLASDKLGVFFDTVKGTKDAELINTAASGTKGEFLGDVSISTGSHKIYAYSPASATISKASDTKVVFTVLDEQYPDSDTFDSDADIVVAKEVDRLTCGKSKLDLLSVLSADKLDLAADLLTGDLAYSLGNCFAVCGIGAAVTP